MLTEARGSSQDEYILVSNGKLFSAVYRHPNHNNAAPPPMKRIPWGPRSGSPGINMFYNSEPLNGPLASDVLMRSIDDLQVIAGPTLLSVRYLVPLVGMLLVFTFAAGTRGLDNRAQKYAARTAVTAYLEQRRSRILEDINSSRPLAAILEQITELVSFKLQGAACWCQVAEGALLGNYPSRFGPAFAWSRRKSRLIPGPRLASSLPLSTRLQSRRPSSRRRSPWPPRLRPSPLRPAASTPISCAAPEFDLPHQHPQPVLARQAARRPDRRYPPSRRNLWTHLQ